MTATNTQCPPEAVLSDFGLGKLDAASADTISLHIETCADCRQRVAGISGDSFVSRLRQAQGAAKPAVRRERTYVPGESIAKSASSTDGSLIKEDGLSGPSQSSDDLARRDGLGSPSSVSAPPELANHPDYELIKELGQGGMGTVYLAKNRMMDRPEVLKVISKALLDRPGALERFQQEIRSAARLAHPNIVAAYSVVRPGDLLVFAMEYVRGQDLAQVVKLRGHLPVANAAFYIQQVALGLQHAHEKGMVHRDIKPNNLMLAIEGKKHIVKILDFGLAKATSEKGAEAGLTKSGQMLGTPDYIAPEQTLDAHQADIRADIYSLGCTLYFLLSGGPPFQESSLYGILEAHHKRDPKPLNLVRPDVSVELAAVVAKMMAKDPAKRYQTPIEVARALVPFFKPGQSVATAPPGDIPQAQPAAETEYGLSASTFTSPIAPATPLPAPGPLPAAVLPRVAKATPAATERSRPSAKPWFRSSLPVGIGLACALPTIAIVLSAVGVFRVRTVDGILVVEVTEPNPDLYLDGEKVTVTWQDGGVKAEVGVKPGTRKVELKKDGFRVYGQEVTLEDRGRTMLLARLEPIKSTTNTQVAPAPSVDAAQRETGEQSLEHEPAPDIANQAPAPDDEEGSTKAAAALKQTPADLNKSQEPSSADEVTPSLAPEGSLVSSKEGSRSKALKRMVVPELTGSETPSAGASTSPTLKVVVPAKRTMGLSQASLLDRGADTGLQVTQGQRIRLVVAGAVRLKRQTVPKSGKHRAPAKSGDDLIVCAIGQPAQQADQRVEGKPAMDFVAQYSGNLFIGIADDSRVDNEGTLTVEIYVEREPAGGRQVEPRGSRPKSPTLAELAAIRQADIDRGKSVRASTDPAEIAEIVGEVAPGFTAKSPVIPGGVAIVAEHFRRRRVLSTHPLNPVAPCTLTSTVDVPADKKTSLTFDVSHSAAGDWQVIVLANGERLYDATVGPTTARNGWLAVSVDLTRFAGQQVVLELQNKATGYSHEWGFWDKVKITSRESQ